MKYGVLGLSIFCTILTACAPRSKNQVLLKKDLGVIVVISNNKELNKIPSDTSVEKIAPDIYRVYGISKEELKNYLPNNKMVEDVVLFTDPTSPSNGIEPDDTFFDLSHNCDIKARKPLPIIDIPSGKEKFILDSIYLNSGEIRISARKSLNAVQYEKQKKKNKLSPSVNEKITNLLSVLTDLFQENGEGIKNLRFSWRLITPLGSKVPRKFENVSDLNFTPDKPGGYTFYLRADDLTSGGCMISSPLVMGATINQEYKKMIPMGSMELTPHELKDFPHLTAINATEAWSLSQGENVTIAILDSGVNYNHPDLNQNIKKNEKEIIGNDIDDDQNGLIDDVYGYDFAFKDNQPFSDDPHGTHVAGLAASQKFGVAKKSQILPVKVSTAAGRTPLGNIIQGIIYATDQGAKIINLSLGFTGAPNEIKDLLKSAFDYAESRGVVIITAAGNGSRLESPVNNDTTMTLPANMEHENNIAVAATDLGGNLANYSQFGFHTVDVAAPGGTNEHPLKSVFSDLSYGPYIKLSGTSMAAPLVSGVVALMISKNQNLNASTIRQALISSSIPTPSLQGKVQSGGVINAEQALRLVPINQLVQTLGL